MKYLLVKELKATDGKFYYEPVTSGLDERGNPVLEYQDMRKMGMICANGTLAQFHKNMKHFLEMNEDFLIASVEDNVYQDLELAFMNLESEIKNMQRKLMNSFAEFGQNLEALKNQFGGVSNGSLNPYTEEEIAELMGCQFLQNESMLCVLNDDMTICTHAIQLAKEEDDDNNEEDYYYNDEDEEDDEDESSVDLFPWIDNSDID